MYAGADFAVITTTSSLFATTAHETVSNPVPDSAGCIIQSTRPLPTSFHAAATGMHKLRGNPAASAQNLASCLATH